MPGFRIPSSGGGIDSIPIPEPDVKRAHRWRIEKFGSVDNRPLLSNDELLLAKSVTMPTFGFEEQNVSGGSIAYKFATKPSFSDLIVAFYDLIGLEPKIRKWYNKVWSAPTGIGQPNDYKDEIVLYLTDGAGNPVDDSWVFINAWPKVINHGELTYESSEFKLLTITVSYDFIEFRKPGLTSAASDIVQSWADATLSAGVAAKVLKGLGGLFD